MPMTFSVILPLYNEVESVELLLEELARTLKRYPGAEVIAVDDGSSDGTTDLLRRLQGTHPFLRVIELARNYGQTTAIAAGMRAAKGDVLLPMDGDGQNDPADIPAFLLKIEEGFDIVSGWRKERRDAWLRSFFSREANRLIRHASGQEIHDYGCTMKAYRKSVVENLGLFGDMHRFLAAYAALHGARVSEILVHHRPRLHGQSKYGFGRIWRVLLDILWLTFFLRSLTRPMHFFGGIGLLSILLGFFFLGLAFFLRQLGGPTLIETPLPVLASLCVIVGVQCLLMGVLAEIAMRTYFRVHPRSSYVVRSSS